MKRNDNPAFPCTTKEVVGVFETTVHHPGMTLRDYFAAALLSGMASNPNLKQGMSNADIAAMAYAMADDMLAEREKGGAE